MGPVFRIEPHAWAAVLWLAWAPANAQIAQPGLAPETATHGVVLVYHHVSDETPASTSVKPEVFRQHLDFLADNDFNILPLGQLAEAMERGQLLPPRSVALSFDDGYISVYTEALPLLEARGWPFTVFVTTQYLDQPGSVHMNWEQLRDLEMRGGTVGNHSTDHEHLIRRRDGESRRAWLKRVKVNIESAQAALERQLRQPLRAFAWPYGEFDAPLEQLLKRLGYVGLGQQSGPVGPQSSLQSLPRFPVATGFDDLPTLEEKLRSRPLPVTVLHPGSRVLGADAGPPELRLRIAPGPFRRQGLRCYVSGQQEARVSWHGEIAMIQASEPLRPGRSKFNCTAPATSEAGVHYWYSHLWIQRQRDGSWYPE